MERGEGSESRKDLRFSIYLTHHRRFVEVNRAALESDIVTKMLPDWIDLIFGYKQRGQAAVENNNVFFYLTYAGSVDVAAIDDPALRSATELQIAHFGQCPMQIFFKPHEKQRVFRGGPKSLKDAIEPHSLPIERSRGILYKPFSGAPMSHWFHLPAEPLGPKVGFIAIRVVNNQRILAVDSTGTFHFYVFEWKMDNKSVSEQEVRAASKASRRKVWRYCQQNCRPLVPYPNHHILRPYVVGSVAR